MRISEYIMQLKEERGYSWSALSEKSGVPISTIRSIANGDVESPNLVPLMGILSALGGSLDEACEMPQKIQQDMETIQETEESGTEELRITIETMRRMRVEMLQHQRESYERELSSLRGENTRLQKEIGSTRLTLRIVLVIAFTIAIAVIGMLAYDITHLDRGWVQAFYGIESSGRSFESILQTVMDYIRGVFT